MRWKFGAFFLASCVILALGSVSSFGAQEVLFEFAYPDGSLGSTFCYTDCDTMQPAGQRIDIAFGPVAVEIDGASDAYIWSGWTGGEWLFQIPCQEKAQEDFFFLQVNGKYEEPDYVVTFFEDDPSWADEEGVIAGNIRIVFVFPPDHFEPGIYVLTGMWISSEECEDCEGGRSDRRFERSITVTVLH
jgi:hypothetical protein